MTKKELAKLLENTEQSIYLTTPVSDLHDIFVLPDMATHKSRETGETMTYLEKRNQLKSLMTDAEYHSLKTIIKSIYDSAGYIYQISLNIQNRD